jgi:hypothetical protein
MYYQNCRGLRSKLDNFRCSVPLINSYDIIVFTETWLVDSISDTELGLQDFVIFRCDRSVSTTRKGRGGGVLLAPKEYLMCQTNNFTYEQLGDCYFECYFGV